jgi:hypothetical protein
VIRAGYHLVSSSRYRRSLGPGGRTRPGRAAPRVRITAVARAPGERYRRQRTMTRCHDIPTLFAGVANAGSGLAP